MLQFIVLVCVVVFLYHSNVDPNSMETTAGDEIRCVVKNSNLPEMVSIFGTLFIVSTFFQLGCGWGNWLVSFLVGLGIFLFGFALLEYGFFHSLIVVGGLLFFISWVLSGAVSVFDNLRTTMTYCFLIAILFGIIGYCGKDSDKPWKSGSRSTESHEDFIKRIGNCSEARWRIRLQYWGRQEDLFYRFEGRTKDAYEVAEELAEQHGTEDYNVVLLNVPPAHARKVGALDWVGSRRYENM